MNENGNRDELDRCRAILIAFFDRLIENYSISMKAKDSYMEGRGIPAWDPVGDSMLVLFEQYKQETEDSYQKGKIDTLRKSLKGFTTPIAKSGDVTFSKYIKEVTGYNFQVENTIGKKIAQISKKGKFKNENQYYEALDAVEIVKKYGEYFDSQTHYETEKLKKMLREFNGIEISEEDTSHFYHELSTSFSPDGLCKLTLIESGSDENHCYTQVKIDFGDIGGSGVYAPRGINLGIKTYWKDNHTIVIETKKEYQSTQKWEQVQMFKDIILVEYLES